MQCVRFHGSKPFLFVATKQQVRIYHLIKQVSLPPPPDPRSVGSVGRMYPRLRRTVICLVCCLFFFATLGLISHGARWATSRTVLVRSKSITACLGVSRPFPRTDLVLSPRVRDSRPFELVDSIRCW